MNPEINPTENTLEETNPGTGDLEFLFDEKDLKSFGKKISSKGLDVLDEEIKDGEIITKVQIPQGEMLFVFGFRQVNLNEKRWYHEGSDNHERYTKFFNFDVSSPEFNDVKNSFLSLINENDDLVTAITELENLIRSSIISDIGYEDSMSLSQIIRNKRGACASKSLLVGSILKESIDELRVELVNGHMASLLDKVSMPFSHAWLRISDGRQCILYDPMYHKIESYTFDTPIDKNMSFGNYTVSAWPFSTLQRIGLKNLLSGIRAVKSYNNPKRIELKVRPELSLQSQLGGQMVGEVYIDKGGIIEFVNGNIQTVTSQNGPRLLYPLLDIQR